MVGAGDAVVVAGGGITGLVAARTLARAGRPVVLVEEDHRLGGKIRTRTIDGAVIEDGPDWWLTTTPAATELCFEIGLGDDLVPPAVIGARIWTKGRMEPLPDGFVRGVPGSPTALMRARSLSPAGRMRALADLALPGPVRGPDVSVGSLVRRRFGNELLERFVDPILAASRSGDPDELSLAAAAPEVDAAARSARSVMRALGRTRRSRPAPSFLGIKGGMQRMVDALQAQLGRADVRLGTSVVALERSRAGYFVELSTGERLDVAGVVLAVPAPAAASMVEPIDAALTARLRLIEYNPCAVASLIYPPAGPPPPAGVSGFLVPSSEGRLLTACAWFSAKWPHARPTGGGTVIRCFAGRTSHDPVLGMTDEELCDRLAEEVSEATGLGSPTAHSVARWNRALPLYGVGHLDLIAAVERSLRRHPGLALAGAGYRGSGLPDCIVQGMGAARRVLDAVAVRPR